MGAVCLCYSAHTQKECKQVSSGGGKPAWRVEEGTEMKRNYGGGDFGGGGGNSIRGMEKQMTESHYPTEEEKSTRICSLLLVHVIG